MKFSRQYLSLALGVIALAVATGPASAAVTPQGAPTDVNKCPTCGERRPAIGGSATQFLTAFEAGNLAEPAGIFARLTLPTGKPKGPAYLTHPATQFNSERAPFLVAYAGGFLMAYESTSPQNNSDVYVLRLSPTGVAVGLPILLKADDLAKPTSETTPSIAVKADGSFVAAWGVTPLAGGPAGPGDPYVETRWFSAAGVPLGDAIKVNTTLSNGGHPAVCFDSTGLAVVAFTTIDAIKPFEPSKVGIAFRRFKSPGAPQGAQVVVAAPKGRGTGVALSCGLNGSFVIAWTSDQAPAADGGDVLYATFDKTGKRVGAIGKLASTILDDQEGVSLMHDTKGNFVAAWESESTTGRAIRGRRFLANGKPDGNDFLVVDKSTIGTRVSRPQVTFLGTTGLFVIEWDEGSQNVWFRRYKAT
jgi:hypothetical protein